MQENNPNGTHYTEHSKTLVEDPFDQRHQAVKELIADTSNKAKTKPIQT